MSKRSPLDANTLAQFTGSQNFYRHSLVREVLYTEGVEYVADAAGAHWLLDEIALAQRYIIPIKREDFQVCDLKVNAGPLAKSRIIRSYRKADARLFQFEPKVRITQNRAYKITVFGPRSCQVGSTSEHAQQWLPAH